MGLTYGRKQVTVDGLILYLDTANPQSYPGSGTTVTDLSGAGNHGTLVNAPTYNTANSGYFSFNGTNNYISIAQANNLTGTGTSITATLEAWVRPLEATGPTQIPIGINNPTNNRFYFGCWQGFWDCGIGSNSMNGTNDSGVKVASPRVWTHVCMTCSSNTATLYVNGAQTITKHSTITGITGVYSIGAYMASGSVEATYTKTSDIASVRVYNRSLSAPEIVKNFNAHRGRFGI